MLRKVFADMKSFWEFFEDMMQAISKDMVPNRGAVMDLPVELPHPKRLCYKAAAGKSSMTQAEALQLVTQFHANMSDIAFLDDLAEFSPACHRAEMEPPSYIF